MEPWEAGLSFFAILSFFGTALGIVRMALFSPRRKALAEAEKQARLRELGLLDGPGSNPGEVAELRARLQERDDKIGELTEERDFLRRLLEEREREGSGSAQARGV